MVVVRNEQERYAARLIGALYALAAASLNEDPEAGEILRSELTAEDLDHMPEAAVAAAASAITRANGTYPEDDESLRAIPAGMRNAIEMLMQGRRPEYVLVDLDEDALDVAVLTLATTWLWCSGGDAADARDRARLSCLRVSIWAES